MKKQTIITSVRFGAILIAVLYCISSISALAADQASFHVITYFEKLGPPAGLVEASSGVFYSTGALIQSSRCPFKGRKPSSPLSPAAGSPGLVWSWATTAGSTPQSSTPPSKPACSRLPLSLVARRFTQCSRLVLSSPKTCRTALFLESPAEPSARFISSPPIETATSPRFTNFPPARLH